MAVPDRKIWIYGGISALCGLVISFLFSEYILWWWISHVLVGILAGGIVDDAIPGIAKRMIGWIPILGNQSIRRGLISILAGVISFFVAEYILWWWISHVLVGILAGWIGISIARESQPTQQQGGRHV